MKTKTISVTIDLQCRTLEVSNSSYSIALRVCSRASSIAKMATGPVNLLSQRIGVTWGGVPFLWEGCLGKVITMAKTNSRLEVVAAQNVGCTVQLYGPTYGKTRKLIGQGLRGVLAFSPTHFFHHHFTSRDVCWSRRQCHSPVALLIMASGIWPTDKSSSEPVRAVDFPALKKDYAIDNSTAHIRMGQRTSRGEDIFMVDQHSLISPAECLECCEAKELLSPQTEPENLWHATTIGLVELMSTQARAFQSFRLRRRP